MWGGKTLTLNPPLYSLWKSSASDIGYPPPQRITLRTSSEVASEALPTAGGGDWEASGKGHRVVDIFSIILWLHEFAVHPDTTVHVASMENPDSTARGATALWINLFGQGPPPPYFWLASRTIVSVIGWQLRLCSIQRIFWTNLFFLFVCFFAVMPIHRNAISPAFLFIRALICNTKDPVSNVLRHRKKNHTLIMDCGLKCLDMWSVHEILQPLMPNQTHACEHFITTIVYLN